jgi:aspartate racemase
MNQNHPPIIGIVSGIGPLAGSDILGKIFKNAALIYHAVEDYEYPDVVLLNHGIKGVDYTAKLSSAFESNIITMSKTIESYGANIIGIACNTAHLYLNQITFNPSTTFINLIDEVSKEASKTKQKYLLLTSKSSKDNRLYQNYLKKYGVDFKETDESQQTLLDQTIELIMAHKLEKASQSIQKVLLSAKKQGFNSVIAACTELPIAIENCKNIYGLKIIDSNDILSKALLRSYYDKLPLT